MKPQYCGYSIEMNDILFFNICPLTITAMVCSFRTGSDDGVSREFRKRNGTTVPTKGNSLPSPRPESLRISMEWNGICGDS